MASVLRDWVLMRPSVDEGNNFYFSPPAFTKQVCLFLYCIFVVKAVEGSFAPGSEKKSKNVERYVRSVLAAYGGSIIVPALLGNSCGIFRSYQPLLFMSMAWILYNSAHTNMLRTSLKTSAALMSLWDFFCQIGFELFRTAVIVGWIEESRITFSAPSAFLGPIVLGGIGGCGGGFMPLSKGLQPIGNGVPWNVESAFLASLTYYVLTLHFNFVKDDAHAVIASGLVILRLTPNRDSLLHFPHRVIESILGLGDQVKRKTGPQKEKQK